VFFGKRRAIICGLKNKDMAASSKGTWERAPSQKRTSASSSAVFGNSGNRRRRDFESKNTHYYIIYLSELYTFFDIYEAR
jgi:hypothetical protein